MKEGEIYVLKDKKQKVEIIWLHHNVLVAEHGERWKMTESVTMSYWWSGVTKYIGKYVNSYDMCQRIIKK